MEATAAPPAAAQESHGTLSGKLPAEKDYLKAAVAFLGAGFLTIHLVFDIYDIVLEPEIFTIFFVLDVTAVLVGLAFA